VHSATNTKTVRLERREKEQVLEVRSYTSASANQIGSPVSYNAPYRYSKIDFADVAWFRICTSLKITTRYNDCQGDRQAIASWQLNDLNANVYHVSHPR
jgi:hypothetical protein